MVIRSHPAYLEVRWDPRDQEDMKRAGRVFEELRKRGYVAYRLKEEGKELVREFESRPGLESA